MKGNSNASKAIKKAAKEKSLCHHRGSNEEVQQAITYKIYPGAKHAFNNDTRKPRTTPRQARRPGSNPANFQETAPSLAGLDSVLYLALSLPAR